uniref:Uncharacterized protein n=1 Tax=Anguilla anguilla TaxID=7936 RepID=A0A0E9U717_ANGAN
MSFYSFFWRKSRNQTR